MRSCSYKNYGALADKKGRLKMDKRENKLIMISLAIFLVVLFTLSCCGAKQSNPAEAEPVKVEIQYAGTEEYTVGAFDTLSHIAVKYIPSDEYMQQWIEDVKRLNGRKTTDIYYGEVIKVYVYEK